MSHRRRQRRFYFPQGLSPEETAFLLGALAVPRWMSERLAQATTRKHWNALLHPARWPGRRGPSDI